MSINLTKSLVEGFTIWKFCNRVGFFHIFSTSWLHVHLEDTFSSTHFSQCIIHVSTYSNNISPIQTPSHLSGFRRGVRGLSPLGPGFEEPGPRAPGRRGGPQGSSTGSSGAPGAALRDAPCHRRTVVPKEPTVRNKRSTMWTFHRSCPSGCLFKKNNF